MSVIGIGNFSIDTSLLVCYAVSTGSYQYFEEVQLPPPVFCDTQIEHSTTYKVTLSHTQNVIPYQAVTICSVVIHIFPNLVLHYKEM